MEVAVPPAASQGNTSGDGDYQFQVGASILAEFALSHTPADILRELVQNEYDAGGDSVEVTFGTEQLTITGNGAGIDTRGWKRLSVMLGTGSIGGSQERIAPKANGIGSKNFGLRSLFLFGDSIQVRSNGLVTMLDRHRGSWRTPQPDPAWDGRPGVLIRVAYRQSDDAPFRRFDLGRQREALASFTHEFAPTLIKLALPTERKGIRSVRVSSDPLGSTIQWKQTVRAVAGIPHAVKRRVSLTTAEPGVAPQASSINEIEYQRLLRPPAQFRGRDVPAYFRAGRGLIRLGVSFRLSGKRLDLASVGNFYYPLGASRSRTRLPVQRQRTI